LGASVTGQLSGIGITNNNQKSAATSVIINADFPGVTAQAEIEAAFANLINRA